MQNLDTGENTVAKTHGWYAPEGANPLTHYVDGVAIHGGEFEMPIITHVKGNLYHGGYVDGLDLDEMFDSVVSLYQWEKYPTKGITYTYTMYDGTDVDVKTIEAAVEQVEACLAESHRTLVHCQAGLNRSGVVVARVLMRQGMSADEAINYLRDVRSDAVLCNKNFEKWLRSLDA
jgi:Dual specificity phosphatase, catalytic domain